MNTDNIKIAFIGSTGFPFRFGAEISKLTLLARALVEAGCKVIVINKRSYPYSQPIPVSGHIYNILYTTASGNSTRHRSFVKRNIYKFKGFINEPFIIKSQRPKAAIVTSYSVLQILYYRLLGIMFGFKLILTYVEYASKMKIRNHPFERLNDFIFERIIFNVIHGILPISEILTKLALKKNPDLPCLKVPVLVDFKNFENINIRKNNQFLFCGSTAYLYIIQFILQSFELVTNQDIKLILVIYGTEKKLDIVKKIIAENIKSNLIELKNDLSYNELATLYKTSIGLLIPLSSSLQDQARFPHKIGEYVASGNTIVTTNIGEIQYYFKDKINAVVADSYDIFKYAEKMNWVIEHPEESALIGQRGYLTGCENFDYSLFGPKIRDFIINIL